MPTGNTNDLDWLRNKTLTVGQCWQCCPSAGTQDPCRVPMVSCCTPCRLQLHLVLLSPWLDISLLPAEPPGLRGVTHALSSLLLTQDSSTNWPLCEDSYGMGGGKVQGRLTEEGDRDRLQGTSNLVCNDDIYNTHYKSNAFLQLKMFKPKI